MDLPRRPLLAGLSVCVISVAALATEPRRAAPAFPTPALSPRATVADVQAVYAASESSVESAYAKLIQEARSAEADLEAKVRDIERRIDSLKAEAKRIQLVSMKVQQVLPAVLSFFGVEPGGTSSARSARQNQLVTYLGSELAKAGASVPPDQIAQTAASIVKGGPGGMASAWAVVLQIASAGSPAPGTRLGPGAFPSLTPADLSNAAAMPGGVAARYLLDRVSRQSDEREKAIGDAIASAKKDIQKLTLEIKNLEAEIAGLEAERAKAIDEIRKRKVKALAEASRLVPTSTPTPGRR